MILSTAKQEVDDISEGAGLGGASELLARARMCIP